MGFVKDSESLSCDILMVIVYEFDGAGDIPPVGRTVTRRRSQNGTHRNGRGFSTSFWQCPTQTGESHMLLDVFMVFLKVAFGG